MSKMKINVWIRYIRLSIVTIITMTTVLGCAQEKVKTLIVPKELIKDNVSNVVKKTSAEKKYHPDQYRYSGDKHHQHSNEHSSKKQVNDYHVHSHNHSETSKKDKDCDNCDEKDNALSESEKSNN